MLKVLGDEARRSWVKRHMPQLPTLAVHPQVLDPPPLGHVLDLELGDLVAAQPVKQKHRQDRPVTHTLERRGIGRSQQRPRLVVTQRRRLALANHSASGGTAASP